MLVGALLLSSIGCLKESKKEEISPEKVKVPSLEWKWYENKEFGFRIKHPTDWKIIEKKKDVQFMEGENFFIVLIEKKGKDFDFEKFIKDHSSYWEDSEEFTIVKCKNVTVGGKPGRQFVIKYEWKLGENHTLPPIFGENENLYVIYKVYTSIFNRGRLYEFCFDKKIATIGNEILESVEFI